MKMKLVKLPRLKIEDSTTPSTRRYGTWYGCGYGYGYGYGGRGTRHASAHLQHPRHPGHPGHLAKIIQDITQISQFHFHSLTTSRVSTIMTPSVVLYAEHLLNIRQVTIFATLLSESSQETRAELSSDRRSLSLTHDGETATIYLPSEIAGDASLTLPTVRSKVLSFRLQVTENVATLGGTQLSQSNEAPWPAASLSSETSVACRGCKDVFVKPSVITTWKDLPSENWAEMMDFWHCHKPDNHEPQKADAPTPMKGYAACNALRTSSGTGLVDLCYLLISEQDCSGIQVRALL